MTATPMFSDALATIAGKTRTVQNHIKDGCVNRAYCAEKLTAVLEKAAEALGTLGVSTDEVQRRASAGHERGANQKLREDLEQFPGSELVDPWAEGRDEPSSGSASNAP